MNKKWLLLIAISILGVNNPAQAGDIDFSGDIRYRVQHEKLDSAEDARLRNRVRYRFGVQAQVNDYITVKAGLASGGADSRSTNQTLENSFQTPGIQLDYVYIQHKYGRSLQVNLGKMQNPLWRPTNLIWDTDIRPEGLAVNYKKDKTNRTFFINAGYFILDEQKTNEDAKLWSFQEGITLTIDEKTKASAAITVYRTQHLQGQALDGSAGTNSKVATTNYSQEFSVVMLSTEVGRSDVIGLPFVGVFSEIGLNTERDTGNKFGIAGIKFGDKKVENKGNWQSKISYRYLAKDAMLDSLPDSDSYGGKTGIQGLRANLKYGLSKKSNLSLTVYGMDKIQDTDSNKEFLVQADYNVKF